MKKLGLVFLAAIVPAAACSSKPTEKLPEEGASKPTAVKATPMRSPDAIFSKSRAPQLLGALEDARLGMTRVEFRQTVPELVALGDTITVGSYDQIGYELHWRGSPETLRSVSLSFGDGNGNRKGSVDSAFSAWGAATRGRKNGRAWFNPEERVRARVLSNRSLNIDEYIPRSEFWGGSDGRLKIEGKTAFLGATVEAIKSEYGWRLLRESEEYLLLWCPADELQFEDFRNIYLYIEDGVIDQVEYVVKHYDDETVKGSLRKLLEDTYGKAKGSEGAKGLELLRFGDSGVSAEELEHGVDGAWRVRHKR